jgi:hypothetical protein
LIFLLCAAQTFVGSRDQHELTSEAIGAMNDLHDLQVIIKSRFPLVVVETFEEVRVLALLENFANLQELALFTWSVTDGLLRKNFRQDRPQQTFQLIDALRHIEQSPQDGLFVLLDTHPWISDPVVVRLMKDIIGAHERTSRTLILVSHRLDVPPELSRFCARFVVPVPDGEAIRKILRDEMSGWELANQGERLRGQKDALELLVQHVHGLPEEDVRRLLRMAIRDDGAITFADVTRALQAKRNLFGAAGMLELEIKPATPDEIGGLNHLKDWLAKRKKVFQTPVAGLEPPKGVLLLGVQGSGKSLAAKTIAGSWGVPLLRMDFGSLYNKFFGETERNLRDALSTAEHMAPCVLWIDELEKGLAADSDGLTDGGISRRVLGTLLTWMAERRSRVFLVATANSIEALPPELVRKGRFDEIFFVDLPELPARAQIFSIHLRRRGIDPASMGCDALAGACPGFSGAEIEQAIVAALYQAHAVGKPLDAAMISDEIQRTRPLAVVMAEQIGALRAWAAERAVPAG